MHKVSEVDFRGEGEIYMHEDDIILLYSLSVHEGAAVRGLSRSRVCISAYTGAPERHLQRC